MSRQRWFANLVLLAASLGSVAIGWMAFATARAYHVGLLRQILFAGGPILLGAGLLACLRLPLHLRVTVAVTLLSLAVAAYGAEAYLRGLPSLRARWAAWRFGIPYDSRSQFEVVRDLRAEGKDAWPAVFPAWQGLTSEKASLLPLGGISDVTTVFCNEMGQYVVYPSDEHGFHNPNGIWSKDLDLAVLGDSYTQGACVPSDQNFVALLRRKYPSTLNLGMAGNGPLLMLAGLREFLVDLKPRIVLWVFTEGNDLISDLHRERTYPRLTAYLQVGHRQGLSGRQAEIDALLRDTIAPEYLSRQRAAMDAQFPLRFLKLWALGQALGPYFGGGKLNDPRADLALFREVIQQAQRDTQQWRGQLYFVYLPAEARYFDERYRGECDEAHQLVLSALRELHISFIDLLPPISRYPDIPELYAHRGSHFSPAGYRLVAETILEALPPPSRDGNSPVGSKSGAEGH